MADGKISDTLRDKLRKLVNDNPEAVEKSAQFIAWSVATVATLKELASPPAPPAPQPSVATRPDTPKFSWGEGSNYSPVDGSDPRVREAFVRVAQKCGVGDVINTMPTLGILGLMEKYLDGLKALNGLQRDGVLPVVGHDDESVPLISVLADQAGWDQLNARWREIVRLRDEVKSLSRDRTNDFNALVGIAVSLGFSEEECRRQGVAYMRRVIGGSIHGTCRDCG